MISIINYGLGNIQAIANIYRQLNVPFRIVTTADELRSAEKIILPGVGSFDWAMKKLSESGMRELLDDLVVGRGRSVLGICVGMQMMAVSSEEGQLGGLGWINAGVRKLPSRDGAREILLPHMGWNDVRPQASGGLFNSLDHGARFYFLHSFAVRPERASDVLAVAEYGGAIPASIRVGNIYGVQFHPEKSHQWGIQLLKNFYEL